MTDSELIKALENKVQGSDYACFEDYEILDLIERQKAELETIKDEKAMVFKLSEEQINEVKEDVLKSVEYNEREIKAEAYKEFAKRLENKIKTECNPYGKPTYDYDTSISILHYIDKLVEEMITDKE